MGRDPLERQRRKRTKTSPTGLLFVRFGRIRTSDLRLRKPLLYPAELRKRGERNGTRRGIFNTQSSLESSSVGRFERRAG